MALVLKDRVRETSTTSGTGTIVLAGAVAGFQTFSAIGNTNTTYYCIADSSTGGWEVGIGTYTASGTTLSRTTVLASSNGGALVAFSANIKDVFCTYPASQSANVNAALTSGRVTFATTDGLLTDSASLTFNGTTLTPNALTVTNAVTLSAGTANGVAYLNGSKVLTTGSALTFDGTNFATTGSVTSAGLSDSGNLTFTGTGNRITGDFSNATVANRVAFQNSVTNGSTQITLLPNGTSVTSLVRAFNNSDPTNAGAAMLYVDGVRVGFDSTITGTGTYLPMTFFTGGSERVRIDTSGNVGIGTSSPSTFGKLVVNATSATTFTGTAVSNIGITGFTNIGDWNGITFNAGGGIPWAKVASQYTSSGSFLSFGTSNNFAAGVTNQALTIDPSGNVGIGTSSPGGKLEVFSPSAANVVLFKAGAGQNSFLSVIGNGNSFLSTSFDIIQDTLNQAQLVQRANAPMLFFTNNTERVRIDSSGNVGIGTSSPGALLQLNKASGAADLRLSVGGTLYANIYASSSDVNIYSITAIPLILGTNNTERARIDSSGNLLLGGTSTPGARVMYIANATTVPASNPSGGGVLYVEGGALKYRGSSGTVTTIANA